MLDWEDQNISWWGCWKPEDNDNLPGSLGLQAATNLNWKNQHESYAQANLCISNLKQYYVP